LNRQGKQGEKTISPQRTQRKNKGFWGVPLNVLAIADVDDLNKIPIRISFLMLCFSL